MYLADPKIFPFLFQLPNLLLQELLEFGGTGSFPRAVNKVNEGHQSQ